GVCARAAATAQRCHCPVHPVSRSGDRPRRAWRHQPHTPASVGGGLRLWPVARFRVCQRVDEHGPATGRDSCGAAALQPGRGGRPDAVRAAHGAARTRFPHPGNMLATLGCGSTSLHRWDTRRLLDAATHRASSWGMAMRPTRDNSRMVIGFGAMTLLLVWTSCAHAHVEHGQAAGFVAGFGHPWSGFDHVIAMIAVGIWGAQLGEPAIWLLPVTFPMVM